MQTPDEDGEEESLEHQAGDDLREVTATSAPPIAEETAMTEVKDSLCFPEEESSLADIFVWEHKGRLVVTDCKAGEAYEWNQNSLLWRALSLAQLADRITRTLEACLLQHARKIGLPLLADRMNTSIAPESGRAERRRCEEQRDNAKKTDALESALCRVRY
jgi:hypothetical protein